MYTKRVLFSTDPDVNLDFCTSHHHLGIFDGGATAILYGNSVKNYRISMGKKLALVTSGAVGLQKTQPDSNQIKKRPPRNSFCIKFFRRPAGWPDYL